MRLLRKIQLWLLQVQAAPTKLAWGMIVIRQGDKFSFPDLVCCRSFVPLSLGHCFLAAGFPKKALWR